MKRGVDLRIGVFLLADGRYSDKIEVEIMEVQE